MPKYNSTFNERHVNYNETRAAFGPSKNDTLDISAILPPDGRQRRQGIGNATRILTDAMRADTPTRRPAGATPQFSVASPRNSPLMVQNTSPRSRIRANHTQMSKTPLEHPANVSRARSPIGMPATSPQSSSAAAPFAIYQDSGEADCCAANSPQRQIAQQPFEIYQESPSRAASGPAASPPGASPGQGNGVDCCGNPRMAMQSLAPASNRSNIPGSGGPPSASDGGWFLPSQAASATSPSRRVTTHTQITRSPTQSPAHSLGRSQTGSPARSPARSPIASPVPPSTPPPQLADPYLYDSLYDHSAFRAPPRSPPGPPPLHYSQYEHSALRAPPRTPNLMQVTPGPRAKLPDPGTPKNVTPYHHPLLPTTTPRRIKARMGFEMPGQNVSHMEQSVGLPQFQPPLASSVFVPPSDSAFLSMNNSGGGGGGGMQQAGGSYINYSEGITSSSLRQASMPQSPQAAAAQQSMAGRAHVQGARSLQYARASPQGAPPNRSMPGAMPIRASPVRQAPSAGQPSPHTQPQAPGPQMIASLQTPRPEGRTTTEREVVGPAGTSRARTVTTVENAAALQARIQEYELYIDQRLARAIQKHTAQLQALIASKQDESPEEQRQIIDQLLRVQTKEFNDLSEELFNAYRLIKEAFSGEQVRTSQSVMEVPGQVITEKTVVEVPGEPDLSALLLQIENAASHEMSINGMGRDVSALVRRHYDAIAELEQMNVNVNVENLTPDQMRRNEQVVKEAKIELKELLMELLNSYREEYQKVVVPEVHNMLHEGREGGVSNIAAHMHELLIKQALELQDLIAKQEALQQEHPDQNMQERHEQEQQTMKEFHLAQLNEEWDKFQRSNPNMMRAMPPIGAGPNDSVGQSQNPAFQTQYRTPPPSGPRGNANHSMNASMPGSAPCSRTAGNVSQAPSMHTSRAATPQGSGRNVSQPPAASARAGNMSQTAQTTNVAQTQATRSTSYREDNLQQQDKSVGLFTAHPVSSEACMCCKCQSQSACKGGGGGSRGSGGGSHRRDANVCNCGMFNELEDIEMAEKEELHRSLKRWQTSRRDVVKSMCRN